MDDDFSFLTGGSGDLNSDGKVDFGELLNDEYDYKHIMKGKGDTGFSKSGSSADKLKRNNSDDAENSKSENNEEIKPGKVIAVLVLFVLMWYCFYFEDTSLYARLSMDIQKTALIISHSAMVIIFLILCYLLFHKEKKSDKQDKQD